MEETVYPKAIGWIDHKIKEFNCKIEELRRLKKLLEEQDGFAPGLDEMLQEMIRRI